MIAVCLDVGNWGVTWAAPMASLVVEQYLNGGLAEKGKKKELRVLNETILTKNQVFK